MITTDVYLLNTSTLNVADTRVSALLSVSRKQKISSIIPDRAKRESCGVELLLCYALRDLYVPPLEISRTPNGKPYIEGSPVYFSLAHTSDYAVCAVAPFEVGVDAEMIREVKDSLSARIISPDDVCKSAVHAWSAKEAFVKLTGEGLGRANLRGICVRDGKAGEGGVEAILKQTEINGIVLSVCAFHEFEMQIKTPTTDEVLSALCEQKLTYSV